MLGLIALVGGNEFRANGREMDRALLARLGTSAPVLVLPTAAAFESPRQAANNGVQHLKRLGALPEPLYVLNRDDAEKEEHAAKIDKVRGVYLAGGDPIHLLETFKESLVWQAIEALHERGGLVAGSSAGAMVLGGQMWAPGEGWRDGLGLGAAARVAIVPHHLTVSARWDVIAMRDSMQPNMTLVGVDEATALLLPDKLVLGEGQVTIYAPDPTPYSHHAVVAEQLN